MRYLSNLEIERREPVGLSGSEAAVTYSAAEVAAARDRMIAELRDLGALRSDGVARAVYSVPRHVFMPEVGLSEAYASEYALVTKRDADGVSLSSVSAARIQAFMLEQADVRPGMRVLEIGSGGYNAALLAELVGVDGEVTTIDIDPDVVDRARRLLAAAGYGRVHVRHADGADGEPEHAPYDRILVTVETADVSPAWVDQLSSDGVITAPLRVRGLTRSMALHRRDDHLVAEDYEVCGFVPMRGADAAAEQLVILHDGEGEQVGLRLDGETVDAGPLVSAMSGPRQRTWSGVLLARGEPFGDLDVYLATVVPRYALMTSTRAARDRGVVASWSPSGISTLLHEDGRSFAYVAMVPADTEATTYDVGAVGHGPHRAQAAAELAALIGQWGRGHRGDRAVFGVYPTGTPDVELPDGRVVERSAHRLTISWPPASEAAPQGAVSEPKGER